MTSTTPTRPHGRLAGPHAGPQRPVGPEAALPRNSALPLLIGVGIAFAIGFVWVMLSGSYDQYAALLIGAALVVMTVPVARHAARVEQWPALAGILMIAMLLRIGGSIARYVIAYGTYGGVADASTYTQVATTHYHAFRAFHIFTPGTGVFDGLVPWLDTVVYAFFGPTEIGSFLVFSWISFIGSYLFYRAFRIGFPRGDGKRYAALVFFLPSLLYWPSSLGKEAWMMLAIGLACYGLARALAGIRGGYIALIAGVGAMILVRPHLALIFLPAAILAFVLRRTRPGMRRRPIGRLVGVAVLVVSSLVVVSKAQSYFGIKSLDVQTITKQLQTTRYQTAEGNSAFSPPDAQSPLGYPEAVVTVLYRPFPFEAHGVTVLVASFEGLVLIGLTVAARRRLIRLPTVLKESPFVTFAVLYCLLFIFAFSNFSNFGILARERVQMLPLFLVVLAITPATEPLRPRIARAMSRRPTPTPAEGKEQPRRLPSYRDAPHLKPVVRSGIRYTLVGRYRALGYTFDVVVGGASSKELSDGVRWAFAGLRETSAVAIEHRYRLTGIPHEDGVRVRIEQDGLAVGGSVPINRLASMLTNELNRQAVESRPYRLTFHAGAVTLRGRAILLPGPSGVGKSTLTAALISIGCGYLTDEAASVDLETLEVEPYQKPLSLAAEASQALGCDGFLPSEWADSTMVPPGQIKSSRLPSAAPVGTIIFPKYVADAPSKLTPIHRSEALIELANNSFNFVDHGGEWLVALKRIVTASTCWRFTVGDVAAAAELVVRL